MYLTLSLSLWLATIYTYWLEQLLVFLSHHRCSTKLWIPECYHQFTAIAVISSRIRYVKSGGEGEKVGISSILFMTSWYLAQADADSSWLSPSAGSQAPISVLPPSFTVSVLIYHLCFDLTYAWKRQYAHSNNCAFLNTCNDSIWEIPKTTNKGLLSSQSCNMQEGCKQYHDAGDKQLICH